MTAEIKFSKLQNVRLRAVREDNPFRQGSFKRAIFGWCLAQGEFTKQEFFNAILTLQEDLEVHSKMAGKILAGAWYNEFLNKHHDIVVIED